MISNEKNISGITRIGIGARLKPECESIESSTLSSRTKHIIKYNASRRKAEGWKCSHCEVILKTRAELAQHVQSEHSEFCSKTKKKSDWSCKYCGKENFGSRRLLFEHYKNCSEKEKLPKDSKGRVIGDYDHQAAAQKAVETMKKNGTLSHPHTEETKKKLSEIRRKNLENGIGNHWINPSIKRSYAEQYFYDCFTNAKLQFESNVWVGHYCLDFKVGNNYFEVDGEQHYTEEGLAKDKRRTEFLQKKGLILVARCRWRDFKKLSLEDRENYLKDIICKLRSVVELGYTLGLSPSAERIESSNLS